MTSAERFAACCNRTTLDRAPVDYTAHHELDRRLRAHLGVESEAELLDALGCDFFYLPARDLSQREEIVPYYKHVERLEFTETERTCPLGIRWRREAFDAKFSVDEAIGGPLQDTTDPRDVLRFPWPKPADFDFSALGEIASSQGNRVRVGGFWTAILGDAYRMHGFQNFLINLAAEPEFVHTLVDRLTDMYLELNDAAFTALKGEIEVWYFGNDFGSQETLLMSRGMWHDFFFDNIRKLTNLAHSHGLTVMMHSCGAIRPLIPLFIEAGADILDPIQVSAKGMDLASLEADFGDRIIFHGGIDTQHLLPEGSPEEVRDAVRSTLKIFDGKGHYILAPSQILNTDIPLENVLAMYSCRALSRDISTLP
ncbi:MAG: uroporphyrinogen decarboxylase family protein [Bryobacteraceae bacterium]